MWLTDQVRPHQGNLWIWPGTHLLFAHYLLAHNIGGHDGPAEAGPRQTVYYRLEARGHRECWREAVTSPLLEFR